MATSLQDNLNNAQAFIGRQAPAPDTGTEVFVGRQKQYLADPTQRFIKKYSKYATDFFEAEVQGLNPDDFYATSWKKIRAANLFGASTTTNIIEGYKNILFEDPSVDYVPRGAKLFFLNSVWLAVNPDNSSSVSGNTVARLCDVTWNFLDYYGNIVSEPFCFQKVNLEGTQNDYTKQMILADNYGYCLMQYNEKSKNLRENTRMILGNAAYAVRGLNNFSQEFTNDPDSVHMIYFVLYREEPTQGDDMENKVADAGGFDWQISIAGSPMLKAGRAQTLVASSLRNGVAPDTDNYPVSYLWSSSDPEIISVDADGTIEAKARGTATITATLEQNPNITASVTIVVTNMQTNYIAFLMDPPSHIAEGMSAKIRASWFVNNAPTAIHIDYAFSGPSERDFSVSVESGEAEITCWRASDIPLHIVASCNGESVEADIVLIGR